MNCAVEIQYCYSLFLLSFACSHLNMHTCTHTQGLSAGQCLAEKTRVSVLHTMSGLSQLIRFQNTIVCCKEYKEVLVGACAFELRHGGCQQSWAMRCL